MSDQFAACCWCNQAAVAELLTERAKVINRQFDLPHTITRCGACQQLNAEASWGNQTHRYRALAYPRRFRAPQYVLLYPVSCAWCKQSESLEPLEINATIGNPASARHHYDIYVCETCQRHTAISYLGQVQQFPATQDKRYTSMYYLELGE